MAIGDAGQISKRFPFITRENAEPVWRRWKVGEPILLVALLILVALVIAALTT